MNKRAPGHGEAPPRPKAQVLKVENLSKHFGGSKALDGVDLQINAQEVHGLLGHNGSGKSTLIKVLAGFHQPEAGGRLWVNGEEISLPITPSRCHALGISFVHQHLGLLPSLTVLENLLLGDLSAQASLYVNWKREQKEARRLFARYGLALDPGATVASITPVEKALLAIVRAFRGLQKTSNPGVLILDEPTPFLPARDVERLFELVRQVVGDGASVIFVSHDIDEVLEITDRATVLRDGQVAGTFRTSEKSKEEIVEMIVGRRMDVARRDIVEVGEKAPVRASVSGLSGGTLSNVSLTVHEGEILGVTGLIGSGYDETVYRIFGASRADEGELSLKGRRVQLQHQTPSRAISDGMVLIPGDRQNLAAINTLTVCDNISMPVFGRVAHSWAISGRRLMANAQRLVDQFNVFPGDSDLLLGNLSGGNQQKVILAKWLQLQPTLILLDEPTQGVDVGAREQLFEQLRAAARSGASIIVASSDFEQLEALCHRILVFGRGRIVNELLADQISKEAIADSCFRSVEAEFMEGQQ